MVLPREASQWMPLMTLSPTIPTFAIVRIQTRLVQRIRDKRRRQGGNVTQCPTSVSLENTAPIQLESDFPTYKTGIGLVASMQVSGSSSASYNNSKVSESLSVNNVMQNTCSAYVSECNGSATFTVGAGGDDTPRMHMSKWQRVALSLISETHVPLQN